MTSNIKSLECLFERELRDLYSAESQLMAALPKMVDAVTDKTLRITIENYRADTAQHIERLSKATSTLGISPDGVVCTGTEGLIQEFTSLSNEEIDPKVMDCAVVGILRHIQHLQIAGFGIAGTFADQLGHHEIAEQLRCSLAEQEAAEKALSALGVRWLNVVATQV